MPLSDRWRQHLLHEEGSNPAVTVMNAKEIHPMLPDEDYGRTEGIEGEGDGDEEGVDEDEFVENDPTGRYGRYKDMLGKGASKKVYRAFDKEEGIEVAWNQALLQDMHHIQCEVQLLKSFMHKNIIKLYSYWVDLEKGHFNFITELCSGTLLRFRKQHKRVCMKAVKDWAKQILRALAYLHNQNPPVVHRDLKCENIFVNCSSGKVKVGDFGSATILGESGRLCTPIGTPEFMAPEMFEQDYNELVDVYAFGMCMLQLLTLECPYKECKSLAHVYKKVTTGIKPKALEKVKDFEALQFINKCLVPASQRPSASVLQLDPFLQSERGFCDHAGIRPTAMLKSASSPNLDCLSLQMAEDAACNKKLISHPSFIGGRSHRKMEVTGKMQNETTVAMKIRIIEPSEPVPVRNVEFLFCLKGDTPQSVAEEMIQMLEFPESDAFLIAGLIASVLATCKPKEGSVTSEGPLQIKNSSCSDLLQLVSENRIDCLPDQTGLWSLSTIPCDSEQQMVENALCGGPSHGQLQSRLPSFLKAIA